MPTRPAPSPQRSQHAKHSTSAVAPARRARGGAVQPDAAGDASPDSPSDRLSALLDQFGAIGGFRALVERAEQGADAEYLGTVPLDESLYDTVRSKWGGGRYQARITDARSQYKGRIPAFRIAGRPRDDDTTASAIGSGPATVVAEPSATERALLESITRLNASVEALARGGAVVSGPADPIDQFTRVAAALRAVTPAPAPAFDAAAMFGLMNGMLEMRERIAETSRPEPRTSGVLDAVREMRPVMERMLDVRDAAQRAPEMHQLPGAPPSETDTIVSNETTWLAPFLPFRRLLIRVADLGRPVTSIVGLVVDNADDETWLAMQDADAAGHFEADIFAAIPELQQSERRRVFVSTVVSELRDMFAEQSDATRSTDAG